MRAASRGQDSVMPDLIIRIDVTVSKGGQWVYSTSIYSAVSHAHEYCTGVHKALSMYFGGLC